MNYWIIFVFSYTCSIYKDSTFMENCEKWHCGVSKTWQVLSGRGLRLINKLSHGRWMYNWNVFLKPTTHIANWSIISHNAMQNEKYTAGNCKQGGFELDSPFINCKHRTSIDLCMWRQNNSAGEMQYSYLPAQYSRINPGCDAFCGW